MPRLLTLLLALSLVTVACADAGDTPEGSAVDDATGSDERDGADGDADDAADADDEASPPATDAPASEAGEDAAEPEPHEVGVSDGYADPAVWVCRPELDDVCARSLDVTVVEVDGSVQVVTVPHAENPEVDCFYAYPTISGDPTANSDLVPQETQEIYVVWPQAARLGAVGDVYAPVYRSNTLGSLGGTIQAPEGVDPYEIAHADVLDAFTHFIANDSGGQGFVLISHSQGAGMLRNLIAEEIDDDPVLRSRMVSAPLLGSGVAVEGDDAFANIAPCTASDQVNCVISYAGFRETTPPPETAYFGRAGGGPALYTNPAAMGGGEGPLDPCFLTGDDVQVVFGGGVEPFADPATAPPNTTSWVTHPDFIRSECVDDGTFGYVSLEIAGDAADPRTDDIGGDLTPEWGLHLVDVNAALGQLVEIVATHAD